MIQRGDLELEQNSLELQEKEQQQDNVDDDDSHILVLSENHQSPPPSSANPQAVVSSSSSNNERKLSEWIFDKIFALPPGEIEGQHFWAPYKATYNLIKSVSDFFESRKMLRLAKKRMTVVEKEIMPLLDHISIHLARLQQDLEINESNIQNLITVAKRQNVNLRSPPSSIREKLINEYEQHKLILQQLEVYNSFRMITIRAVELFFLESTNIRMTNMFNRLSQVEIFDSRRTQWRDQERTFIHRTMHAQNSVREIEGINLSVAQVNNQANAARSQLKQRDNEELWSEFSQNFIF